MIPPANGKSRDSLAYSPSLCSEWSRKKLVVKMKTCNNSPISQSLSAIVVDSAT